jgi:hypothetical protein
MGNPGIRLSAVHRNDDQPCRRATADTPDAPQVVDHQAQLQHRLHVRHDASEKSQGDEIAKKVGALQREGRSGGIKQYLPRSGANTSSINPHLNEETPRATRPFHGQTDLLKVMR